jgi:hypothetical protein
MATMYPADPAYHRPESEAERRLYGALADALPDRYHVLCNRHWQLPGRGGRPPRKAEADFLVAHPDRGVLVLEVKGGGIRYDPISGAWTSTDRQGVTHQIKDPFAQVERTRYLLRDLLKGSAVRPVVDGRLLAEAVAFPDGSRVKLPASYQPERVITADDLDGPDSLRRAVDRAFDAGGLPHRSGALGGAAVHALVDAVGGRVDVPRLLGLELERLDRELVRLTEEQYSVLAALDGNPRVLVVGPAGTGKTLLAVEQARRLAWQGHRVLLTCFNRALSGFLRRELEGQDGIEVLNFHSLCWQWAYAAGLSVAKPPGQTQREYNESYLPELLVEAADRLGDRRVDAIVLDEAQDFRPDWLAALQLLLKHEDESVFFMFGDDNQAVYGCRLTAPPGFMRFALSANCRNTRPIHRVLGECFGDPSRALGPDGEDVRIVAWDGEGGLVSAVGAELRRLEGAGVALSDVTVLTGRSPARSRLAGAEAGGLRLVPVPEGPHDVRLSSVHAFKGLESRVVILCELEGVYLGSASEVWYTGISRARTHLVVLVDKKDYPAPGGLRQVLRRLGVCVGASAPAARLRS